MSLENPTTMENRRVGKLGAIGHRREIEKEQRGRPEDSDEQPRRTGARTENRDTLIVPAGERADTDRDEKDAVYQREKVVIQKHRTLNEGERQKICQIADAKRREHLAAADELRRAAHPADDHGDRANEDAHQTIGFAKSTIHRSLPCSALRVE